MEMDALREKMPRYIWGALPEREMLEISQALADSPEAIGEMRFCLMMRQAVLPEEAPLPAFPNLLEQGGTTPSILPRSVSRSVGLLRGAANVTRSAIRTAMNFL